MKNMRVGKKRNREREAGGGEKGGFFKEKERERETISKMGVIHKYQELFPIVG